MVAVPLGTGDCSIVMAKEEQHIRVLVVDDDRFGRAYPRWILERRFGAEVLEADNGLNALEILTQTEVDAIVTDLAMPGLGGLEMLQFIRSDPRGAATEVIITSAYSYEQSVRRAIELGVSDFVAKPFQPADMEKKLGALMQRVERNRRLRTDNEASRDQRRVLVADGDPNFCALADSSLAGRYVVKQAASSLDVLILIKNWNPDLLLINPQLLGLELNLLLDQIWNLGLSRGLRVYLLGERGGTRQPVDRRIAGWVQRSFVTEVFATAVIHILEPHKITAYNAWEWLKKLEPEIVSAVRQVLGMLTEIEPAPVELVPLPPFSMFCTLALTAADSGLRLLIELACHRSLALKLAMKMTTLEESLIDRQMLEGGIGEVVSVVGGRIQESCRMRDLRLELGLPKISESPVEQPLHCLFQWKSCFQWTAEETFLLSLFSYQTSDSASPPAAAKSGTPITGASTL